MEKAKSIFDITVKPRTVYNFYKINIIKRLAINPVLLFSALKLVMLISKYFFIDQFVYKARINIDKLRNKEDGFFAKNIEHEMDSIIPTRYEETGLYLSFISLWISALSYFSNEFGKNFDSIILDFISGLGRCYVDAAGIYGKGLTTTRRPQKAPSHKLAFVYALDPHLFCVPSLHVIIVCYTYKKMEEILCAMEAQKKYSNELEELKRRAIAISESILYVRQHSINCIPTALAALSVILPAYTESEAKSFMEKLWKDIIPEADRNKIIAYMLNLYDSVSIKGSSNIYNEITAFVKAYDNGIVLES